MTITLDKTTEAIVRQRAAEAGCSDVEAFAIQLLVAEPALPEPEPGDETDNPYAGMDAGEEVLARARDVKHNNLSYEESVLPYRSEV